MDKSIDIKFMPGDIVMRRDIRSYYDGLYIVTGIFQTSNPFDRRVWYDLIQTGNMRKLNGLCSVIDECCVLCGHVDIDKFNDAFAKMEKMKGLLEIVQKAKSQL